MEYTTKGTCSRKILFEITEDNKLHNVQFVGGCNGNTKGIASLVEGMDADEVIKRLKAQTATDAELHVRISWQEHWRLQSSKDREDTFPSAVHKKNAVIFKYLFPFLKSKETIVFENGSVLFHSFPCYLFCYLSCNLSCFFLFRFPPICPIYHKDC